MKKLILVLVMVLFAGYVQADVYVAYDKNTNDIISISNENDCVLQPGQAIKKIKDKNLDDIVIVYPPNCYKLVGNALKPNMDKISKKEAKELKKFNKEKENRAIKKYMKNKSIDEMIANGYDFKYDHHEE